jgi:hypothetical protein
MALYRPLYVGAVPPVVVFSGLKVSVPGPKVEVNNSVGPCPCVKLLPLLVPWLRKNSGLVQLNGGSAAAGVVGAVVGMVVAVGVRAVVSGVGVVGAVVGVVVVFGATVLGVLGVVVVAVDGDAGGIGAPAGVGAARDRVPIAKPATSVTQMRDIPALRPSLSRRRR